jgi:hypothetical protein
MISKSATTFGALAILALLMGCNEAAEPRACVQQHSLLADQGAGLNSETINGWSHNGIVPNGIVPNGIVPNGIVPNGWSHNGMALGALSDNGVVLQGTELRAVVDGVMIEGQAWVGATLEAPTTGGGRVSLTITAVERDPADPELVYFVLEAPGGHNVCGPAGRGLFVRGVWDQTGARNDTSGQLSYSCDSGVIAKCVAWGYKPWRVGPDLHQACTRMARADYCGDGVAHTTAGTRIDLFDGQGIQKPSAVPGDGFMFEAGWDAGGAVCVAHPRYRDVGADGHVRLPSCWSALPGCQDARAAESHGALLANASVENERRICGE